MFTRKNVEQLSAQGNEPEWLRALRLEAWELFESTKWVPPPDAPILKYYTKVHELDLSQFLAPGTAAERRAGGTGAVVCDLRSAANAERGKMEHTLRTLVSPTEDKFACLNLALWSTGNFVYVPPKTELSTPIRLETRYSGGSGFERNLVILGEGARAEVVEVSSSQDGKRLVSEITEVFAAPGARLDYYSISDHGRETTRVSFKRAKAGERAEMRWHSLELGSGLTKLQIDTTFTGEQGKGHNLGVFLARGRQHIDFAANVKHEKAKNTHDIIGRGVVMDETTAIHRGLIEIEQQAGQTNSNFESKVLSLGEKARANSLPTLVIKTNDVRAKHAASVGQVDEEQLFYLQSRGLLREEARDLLVGGFFEPVLQKIDNLRMQGEFRYTLGRALRQEMEMVASA